MRDAWWDNGDIPFLLDGIHTDRGYEGTDEYQPLGSTTAQPAGLYAEFRRQSDDLASNATNQSSTRRQGKLIPPMGFACARGRQNRKLCVASKCPLITFAVRLVHIQRGHYSLM